MSRTTGTVASELIQAHRGKGHDTYPKGRVCADDCCDTVLSVYNAKNVCSVHDETEGPISNQWLRGMRPGA